MTTIVRFPPRFQPPFHAREWEIGLAFQGAIGGTPVVLALQSPPSLPSGIFVADGEVGVIDQIVIGSNLLDPQSDCRYRFLKIDNPDLNNPVPALTQAQFFGNPAMPIGDQRGTLLGPTVGAAVYTTAIAPQIVTRKIDTHVWIPPNTLVQLWGFSFTNNTLLMGFFHGWTWNRNVAIDTDESEAQ